MCTQYQLPDLTRRSFARTNRQTIAQRVALLRELLPDARSVADICCGDCSRQWETYRRTLGLEAYRGLDLHPEIVAANRARGIDCVCGDALDRAVLAQFLDFDVLFFGPPLSVHCDGHSLLRFRQVVPGFADFLRLLLGVLNYEGTVVCICPKATTMGDIRWLYAQVRELRADVGLRLIHHSVATLTGDDEVTEPRLKYVELWFSSWLDDRWEVRKPEADMPAELSFLE
jgi:hypothetical protein